MRRSVVVVLCVTFIVVAVNAGRTKRKSLEAAKHGVVRPHPHGRLRGHKTVDESPHSVYKDEWMKMTKYSKIKNSDCKKKCGKHQICLLDSSTGETDCFSRHSFREGRRLFRKFRDHDAEGLRKTIENYSKHHQKHNGKHPKNNHHNHNNIDHVDRQDHQKLTPKDFVEKKQDHPQKKHHPHHKKHQQNHPHHKKMEKKEHQHKPEHPPRVQPKHKNEHPQHEKEHSQHKIEHSQHKKEHLQHKNEHPHHKKHHTQHTNQLPEFKKEHPQHKKEHPHHKKELSQHANEHPQHKKEHVQHKKDHPHERQHQKKGEITSNHSGPQKKEEVVKLHAVIKPSSVQGHVVGASEQEAKKMVDAQVALQTAKAKKVIRKLAGHKSHHKKGPHKGRKHKGQKHHGKHHGKPKFPKHHVCSKADLDIMSSRLTDWFALLHARSEEKLHIKLPIHKHVHKCDCQETAVWVFHQFDHDHDLHLNHSELQHLEANHNEKCLVPYLQSCDHNLDSLLTRKEWCCCFAKTQPPCLKTKWSLQEHNLLGSYNPRCDEEGYYRKEQCHASTGYCWCVDLNGNEIPKTRSRKRANCDKFSVMGFEMKN